MTLLPIVQRELRVGARHALPRWGRVVAVAVGALLCFQFFARFLPGPGVVNGQPVFDALTWTTFLLALCMFTITGDSLSRERREGTLGLLFLTDLRGYDVVLGKLAGSGLVVLYALLGFAPLFMLPIMAGGVTWGEILRATLAILNIAMVSLAVGVWRSARTSRSVAAWRSAIGWLAVICLGPLAVSEFLPWHGSAGLACLSPVVAFGVSGDSHYSTFGGHYLRSLMVGQLEAWGMLALAARALSWNWREEMRASSLPNPVLARRARWRRRRLGRVAVKLSPYYRSFAPVAVAVLRLRGLRLAAWIGGCLGLLGGLLSAVSGRGIYYSVYGVTLATYLIMSGLFAWVAGRFLCEARGNGELELLMTTTGGASGIVRDQWFAVVRLLRGPLLLIGIGAVPAAAMMVSVGATLGGADFAGLLAGVLSMANAILGVYAICWVAMWRGFTARRSAHLVLWVLGLVVGLPALVQLLALYVIQHLVPGTGRGAGPLIWAWLLTQPILDLLKNLFFIWWANRRLCTLLRVPTVRWFAGPLARPQAPAEIKPLGLPSSPG